MKRVYISGPMTGKKDFNRPAFEAASKLVAASGFTPVLPVDFVDGKTYEQYLRDDLRLLLECDYIYMLDGWQESKGAKLEHMVALACGIDEITI